MTRTSTGPSRALMGAGLAMILLVAELVALSLIYQHNFEFTCREAAPAGFCAFAGRIVPRALAVLAALGLFALARPAAITALRGHATPLAGPLALNITGFLMVLLPWGFVSDASAGAVVLSAAALWSVGGLMTAAGLALMLAPALAWRQMLSQFGLLLGLLITLAVVLPELSDLLQPLWRFDWVTEVTFSAVVWCLAALGYAVESYPDTHTIGAEDFFVAVGPQCSGVEGFALITVFLGIYMTLFRRDLRFPHVLVLLPIGIALSWLFNVARITALLSMGIEISPELAIGGFHSHAGWLAFILLSIGLIMVSRTIPFFTSETARAPKTTKALPPFFSDPIVAQVLPFVVFMASALLASTFSETPSVLYHWRVLAMGLGLAIFWPYLRALPWRLDPIALGSGLLIGVLWIATGPEASGTPPFGTLTGMAFTIWIIARLIGTALFVPIIEELMFRGYITNRIAPEGAPIWKVAIAIAVSAGLFALLHDRWLAALLAGVVFSLVVWRSRNLTDAIVSHATANLSIALWALVTGAWHIL
jgi:exosortase E/protease (VPEID-CTERM system)